MRKIAPLLAAFLIGALLFALAPASAHHGRLKKRVAVLEEKVQALEEGAPKGGPIEEEIANLKRRADNLEQADNHFYNVTQHLGYQGNYQGDIWRQQVILQTDDGCGNGQPRAAQWSNNRLNC
jgi:hypothetical protein